MLTKQQQRKEESIKANMGRCIHFRGIQHKLCKADVNLRELIGGPDLGWARRIPCLVMDSVECTVSCDKRVFPTREQAEAEEIEHEREAKEMLKAFDIAHEHASSLGLGLGKGGRGSLPCPKGCGGMLQYSVASVNGHMHARCTTKDCLSWME
jgi:hypothetical protein